MQIFTASYFTYTGPGRVGISQGTPRGVKAGYRFYRKLAPTWDMVKRMDRPGYEHAFHAMLDALDPEVVVREIQALHPTSDRIVLLCFEKPPFTPTNWCHRRTLVAPWLEQYLSAPVLEVADADFPMEVVGAG